VGPSPDAEARRMRSLPLAFRFIEPRQVLAIPVEVEKQVGEFSGGVAGYLFCTAGQSRGGYQYNELSSAVCFRIHNP
jgi:hypothetical protein